MSVQVELSWCDGDPCFRVTEFDGGLLVEADPRLSLAQVEQACNALGDIGDQVRQAWQTRVGLSGESKAS